MSSKRIRQIADLIQRQLAIALRQEIQDPRLANMAITGVVLTPDLKQAKIYFTLVDDKKLTEVTEALRHAAGHFRHLIAMNCGLRYTPALNFYYDESIVYGERLGRLLNKLERDNEDASKES